MISLAFRLSIHGSWIVVGAEGNEALCILRKHAFHLHLTTIQFPGNSNRDAIPSIHNIHSYISITQQQQNIGEGFLCCSGCHSCGYHRCWSGRKCGLFLLVKARIPSAAHNDDISTKWQPKQTNKSIVYTPKTQTHTYRESLYECY